MLHALLLRRPAMFMLQKYPCFQSIKGSQDDKHNICALK